MIGAKNRRLQIILSLLLFITYALCLLVYYPGVGMNDGLNILLHGMGDGGQFPPAYISIITFFRSIGDLCGGNYNISIALYSWCQVILVSVITAWIITWIFQRTGSRALLWLSILYFAVIPVFPMYAISMLKDTLWSLLLVVYVILIHELIYGGYGNSRKLWVIVGLVTVGIVLLRNNGIYIMIPSLLLIMFSRKSSRKNAGIILALDIFVSFYVGLISPEPLFQEKAAIPLQQVCAVVANDGIMTEEQKEFINLIMPLEDIKANYNPHTVDTIKWNHAKFRSIIFEEYKDKFMKIWAEMLPKNFGIYVKAYLDQSFYFWAPIQHGTQAFYTIETYADNDWLLDFVKEKNIHDAPIITGKVGELLRNYYKGASYFISEGVLWWIIVISLVYTCIRTKKTGDYICIYSPLLFLWVTIMLSTPVAGSLRYVLAYAYALPVVASFLWIREHAGYQDTAGRQDTATFHNPLA